MINRAPDYDIAAIRQQLLHTFAAETLPRFCQDHPTFRPILQHFGPKYNLYEMVDEVIHYCLERHLWPQLLAELEGYDPSRNTHPAPYQAPRPLPEFVGREFVNFPIRCSLFGTRLASGSRTTHRGRCVARGWLTHNNKVGIQRRG